MPPAVHAWVESTLEAPVVDVQARVGGMSPAVAASVRAANGETAFVKAVSPEIHPDTPTHFRHEMEVLAALAVLPRVPYRAATLSTYDDGDWVAIALEDIDGRYPDWNLDRLTGQPCSRRCATTDPRTHTGPAGDARRPPTTAAS